jgi:hypothetical protein
MAMRAETGDAPPERLVNVLVHEGDLQLCIIEGTDVQVLLLELVAIEGGVLRVGIIRGIKEPHLLALPLEN